MVDKAGMYGGGLEITCILYEGNITVTSGTSVFVENGALGKNSYTLADEIKEGDFVGIHVDAANDYDSCGGLPVVSNNVAHLAATGIIGIVKSQPVWHKIPTTTQSSWNAARLSNGFFRIATVVMPGVAMAFKSTSTGTAILSGSPIEWRIDPAGDTTYAGAFQDNSTTFGGFFSFHDAQTDGENLLVGVAPGMGAGGTDADCAGLITVA
tara:strand:- start:282 stop:911 length:630 start_codon:yes stop_codon:yes gene_type:complete